MSIYEILPVLDLTQSVHAKISIGMHRVVKLKISRIPLIGLETRLGWYIYKFYLKSEYKNKICICIILISFQALSRVFWKFLIWPPGAFRWIWRTDRKFLRNPNLNEITIASIGPSDKILTRSDLNYFTSDPMSGAIFSNLGPTKRLKMTGIITYFRFSNLSLFAISDCRLYNQILTSHWRVWLLIVKPIPDGRSSIFRKLRFYLKKN
jgi:hypothetical protein